MLILCSYPVHRDDLRRTEMNLALRGRREKQPFIQNVNEMPEILLGGQDRTHVDNAGSSFAGRVPNFPPQIGRGFKMLLWPRATNSLIYHPGVHCVVAVRRKLSNMEFWAQQQPTFF